MSKNHTSFFVFIVKTEEFTASISLLDKIVQLRYTF